LARYTKYRFGGASSNGYTAVVLQGSLTNEGLMQVKRERVQPEFTSFAEGGPVP